MYVPGRHGYCDGFVVPSGQKWPAEHAELGAVSPAAVHADPAGQRVHAETSCSPAAPPNVPAGHCVQEFEPAKQ